MVDQLWTDYGADPDAAIDEYTYGYDRVGNRLWKENVTAGELGTPVHLDELYAYDELYRLVGTERGNLNGTADGIVSGTENFEQAWDLDGLGNWAEFDSDDDGDGTWDLEQDREVNTSGEITGVTEEQGQTAWVTPGYDAAGNMTTIPLPSDPTVAQTAVYDAWNRLVEVKQGTDTVAVYEYDGLGRRVVRGVDTASPGDPDGTLDTFEHFLYGGVNVVETRDAAAADAQAENLQPHYQYVWSARYVDSPVLRDENTDADDTCDDGRVYYLTDALGNVTALVDSTGTVLERYVYDPYGQVTIYNADWSDTRTASSYQNTRLYTGREFDPTTGLYYYRARWYDTATGNFTTRDPLGFAAGDANLYRYVGNRPVGSTDPSGLWEAGGSSGGFQGTWAAGMLPMIGDVVSAAGRPSPGIGTESGDSSGSGGSQDSVYDTDPKVYLCQKPVYKWGLRAGTHTRIIVSLLKPGIHGYYRTYDGGGEQSVDPDTGRPVPFDKWIDFPPEGFDRFYVSSPYKDSRATIAALDAAFDKMDQLPYSRLGPNCNTFAHQLLDNAGFTVPEWTEEKLTTAMCVHAFVTVPVGPPTTIGWDCDDYGGDEYDKWGNAR